ncbi:MAG: HEAT repeat domain-containing protein [Acidobacteriota bacterium]|nr:HEAT repeat domain-containing protein [Acidobacteriota bacterium]
MKTKMLAILFLATPLLAAPPRVTNGTVQTLGSLAQVESLPSSSWVGYGITTARALSINCCGNWSANCSSCRLNNDDGFSINQRDPDDLGPSDAHVLLFAHLHDRQIDRIRFFSPDCNVDANGQSIYWIDNVGQAESIAFLRNVVDRGTERGRDGALLALSMHAGATDTLIDIARNNSSGHTRGKALFWLSQQAGRKAADALRDAVDNDPEAEVKSKAVFGISQLPNDQSIPLLIDLLKHHRSREVRKKAAFWLGQKNDPRALDAIADILKQ